MLPATKATFAPRFKNIFFPTDFSRCSEPALPYARAIAERYGLIRQNKLRHFCNDVEGEIPTRLKHCVALGAGRGRLQV
jgi:hypothetical protein